MASAPPKRQFNGENKLACPQLVGDLVAEDRDTIRLAPMLSAPVVKDLVIDQSQFFEKYREIKPRLISREPAPEREQKQSPEELEMIEGATKCIMCRACTHSCPST